MSEYHFPLMQEANDNGSNSCIQLWFRAIVADAEIEKVITNGPEFAAGHLIGWLWSNGFKVVPLGKEDMQ